MSAGCTNNNNNNNRKFIKKTKKLACSQHTDIWICTFVSVFIGWYMHTVVFISDSQPFASKPTTHLCRWCQWSLRVLRQVFPWRSASSLCWRRWVSSWGCVCRLHAAYKVAKWLHKRMVGTPRWRAAYKVAKWLHKRMVGTLRWRAAYKVAKWLHKRMVGTLRWRGVYKVAKWLHKRMVGTPWWCGAYKVAKWLHKRMVGTLRWRGVYKVAKWLQKGIEDGGTTLQAVFMATMFLTVTVDCIRQVNTWDHFLC